MKILHKIVVAGALIAGQKSAAIAQTDALEVKNAINRLFEAMQKSDSAGVVDAFWPGATLQSVSRTKEGKVVVQTVPITAFGSNVARSKPGDLEERITFDAIQIDGDLASVWTPFEFYLRSKLSHKGTNSFQVVRKDGVWKIQYIIDTRR
ncbi:MAG: nuclear transport factor 2 family protein [Chitinophagaceae bacterium]|jgi:hypothetical protein|nr:nuclear transport factor 2 family protein [Chitinophagaceae bacterium]